MVFDQENHELGSAKSDLRGVTHEKRQNEVSGGGWNRQKKQQFNAQQIDAKFVRKNWCRLSGLPWQVVSVAVELELRRANN